MLSPDIKIEKDLRVTRCKNRKNPHVPPDVKIEKDLRVSRDVKIEKDLRVSPNVKIGKDLRVTTRCNNRKRTMCVTRCKNRKTPTCVTRHKNRKRTICVTRCKNRKRPKCKGKISGIYFQKLFLIYHLKTSEYRSIKILSTTVTVQQLLVGKRTKSNEPSNHHTTVNKFWFGLISLLDDISTFEGI